MKIIIPAVKNGDFATEVHDNFGRATFFAVVDTDTDQLKFIENSAAQKSSGAGVGAAQLCADIDADIAAAYHFGPKAYQALKAAGIKVLALNQQQSIQDVYDDYQVGQLAKAKAGPGGQH